LCCHNSQTINPFEWPISIALQCNGNELGWERPPPSEALIREKKKRKGKERHSTANTQHKTRSTLQPPRSPTARINATPQPQDQDLSVRCRLDRQQTRLQVHARIIVRAFQQITNNRSPIGIYRVISYLLLVLPFFFTPSSRLLIPITDIFVLGRNAPKSARMQPVYLFLTWWNKQHEQHSSLSLCILFLHEQSYRLVSGGVRLVCCVRRPGERPPCLPVCSVPLLIGTPGEHDVAWSPCSTSALTSARA
jgi:hypothetical protein